MDASFRSFIKAFAGHWLVAVSGIFGIPLTVASIFVPTAPLKLLAAIVGIAAFTYASYQVWKAEREAVIAAQPPRVKVREITGHRSADILDSDEVVIADGSGNTPIGLRLPAVPAIGRRIEIKKGPDPNPAAAVMIEGNGHKIDGREVYGLHFANQAVTLTFIGTGWMIS